MIKVKYPIHDGKMKVMAFPKEKLNSFLKTVNPKFYYIWNEERQAWEIAY